MLGLSSGLIKGTSVLRSIVKKGLQAWYKADNTQAPLGEEEIANGEFTTGPEVVINGNFASNSNWTSDDGSFVISGGKANATNSQYHPALEQAFTHLDKKYSVTYTISNYSSGSILAYVGGTGQGTIRTSNGTYTEIIQAGGSNYIGFRTLNSFNGSVDNVSVKQTNPNDSWLIANGSVNNSEVTIKDGSTFIDYDSTDNQNTGISIGGIVTLNKKYRVEIVVDSLSVDKKLKVHTGNDSNTLSVGVNTFEMMSTNGNTFSIARTENETSVTAVVSKASLKEITNSVKDFSSNNNNGVLYSGKCLHFDQANTYIDIDYWASKTIDANTKATFATWVNPDDITPGDYIFGAWTVDNAALFYLGIKQNKLDLGWGDSGWTNSVTSGALPTLVNHTWYRVVAVVDGLTCKVYLNGEFVFSKTNSSSFTINSEGISIGAQGDDHGDHLYGELADFQIYDKAWTPSDVAYDYNNPDKDVFDDEGRAQVLGEELVSNGDFTNNITGWTAKDSTISYDNGKLRVSGTTNNNGGAYQDIGLVEGKYYKMTATMQLLTGSSNGTFTLLTSQSNGTGQTAVYTGSTLVTGGDAVTETFIFTPGTGDVSIQLSSNESNATYTVDNISVKEVLTHAGEIYPTDCTALYRLNEGAGDRVYNAAPVLGEEIIPNPDLTSSLDDWNIENNSSTHTITHTANGARFIAPDINPIMVFSPTSAPITAGKMYRLEVVISEFRGTGGLKIANTDVFDNYPNDTASGTINFDSAGTHTHVFIAGVNGSPFAFYRNASSVDLTIKSVSVKEISLSESYVQASWASSNWITAQPYIPQYAMSSYSKKMFFDGSNDYIELATEKTIAAADAFSLSFWYYNIDTSNSRVILGKDGSTDDYLSLGAGDESLIFKAGGSSKTLDFNSDLIAGKLNHIVLTSPGGTGTMKCYLNGILQDDTENSLNADFDYRHIFRNATDYGKGFIDELAHFSKELSEAETQEIFNAGMALDCRDHSAYLGSEMVSNGDFSSIGSELVTNGDFSGNPASWTPPNEWTISGGKASANTTGISKALVQNISVVDAKLYNVSVEISDYVKGSLQVQFDGYIIPAVWGNGVYNFTVSSPATNVTLYLYAMNESKFSIDNISIKEIEGDWRALEGGNQYLGWSQTGWSIANGKASVDHNNTDLTAMELSKSSFGQVAGRTYSISFEISDYVSGTFQPQFNGQIIAGVTANGVYNYIVSANNTGGSFYLYALSSPKFSVDNVSVKEVDLKGYWRNNGTDAWTDLSPYGNNGTVNGSPTTIQLQEVPYFKKDTFGLPMNKVREKGLNLDGSSYITVDDSTGFNFGTTGFTVQFWVKPKSMSADMRLVTKGVTGNGEWMISIASDNSVRVYAKDSAGNELDSGAPSSAFSTLTANNWAMVTVVVDTPNDKILFYKDNQSTPTEKTGVSWSGNFNNTRPLVVGDHYLGSTKFDGIIDDVKIYNKVLSKSEITKNYKATRSKHVSTSNWSDDFSDGFI